MLEIASTKQLVASMELAKETGTEDQLIHYLLYLDSWYGKDTTVVKIYADIPFSKSLIHWCAHHINAETHKPETNAFYNGGLVYSDHDWSIHS